MKLFYKFFVIFILFALLAIPDNKNSIHVPEKDGLSSYERWWGKYAQTLVKYRTTGKQNQIVEYNKQRELLKKQLDRLLLELTEPDHPILDSINQQVNQLSALVSLVPGTIHEFEEDVATWRKLVKYQSRYWDPSSDYASERLFQFIIEGRLAFESALIQSQGNHLQWNSPKEMTTDHSLAYHKYQYESGDIIAFSTNSKDDSYFSIFKELPNVTTHLGSIYIKESVISVIFIDHEKGLVLIGIDEFIKTIAPNGVILRLRNDIPDLLRNPLLPSLAASTIHNMALNGQYKYDYSFDEESHADLYDWELIRKGFQQHDFSLEGSLYTRNSFAMNIGGANSHHMPFELELDHRFIIKGEWHHAGLLFEQRLLTAATSTIIENQSHQDLISYIKLPAYRIIKFYSILIGQFGVSQPIPSGVSAQSQLIYDELNTKQEKLLSLLKPALVNYEKKQKHKATYLKIMQKANEIMAEQKGN
ncbi:MAG: hypothetical protein L3J29_02285 [Cyclobacteriaceae bacterium]|nr:hypothetical protein [Cyclobacteriaceae bacterium]